MVFIDNIEILVNKDNILDQDYTPDNLVYTDNNDNNFHKYINPQAKPEVVEKVLIAFKKLQEAARKENLHIIIDSGYRSYAYQQSIWEHNIKTKGLDHTMQFVAPPGASEHQTGLAVDIARFINNQYDDNIDEFCSEYIWMINNSFKYGFILRYPKDKKEITSYNFEPWHFRYVGIALATKLHDDNITLEEYHKNKHTLLKK